MKFSRNGWGQYNCHQRSQWLCKLSCQPGKYKITLGWSKRRWINVVLQFESGNNHLVQRASITHVYLSIVVYIQINRKVRWYQNATVIQPKEREKCTYVNRKICTDSNATVLMIKSFLASNLSFLDLLLSLFDFRPVVPPYCRACLKLWNKSGKGQCSYYYCI